MVLYTQMPLWKCWEVQKDYHETHQTQQTLLREGTRSDVKRLTRQFSKRSEVNISKQKNVARVLTDVSKQF